MEGEREVEGERERGKGGWGREGGRGGGGRERSREGGERRERVSTRERKGTADGHTNKTDLLHLIMFWNSVFPDTFHSVWIQENIPPGDCDVYNL